MSLLVVDMIAMIVFGRWCNNKEHKMCRELCGPYLSGGRRVAVGRRVCSRFQVRGKSRRLTKHLITPALPIGVLTYNKVKSISAAEAGAEMVGVCLNRVMTYTCVPVCRYLARYEAYYGS